MLLCFLVITSDGRFDPCGMGGVFVWCRYSLRAGSLLGARARAAEPQKRATKPSPLTFATPPLTRETSKENLLADLCR